MWTCADCKLERAKPLSRPPMGWKKRGEAMYCGVCWRKLYVLRAVTIPVVSPLTCSWDEFGAQLRAQWLVITRASNWMMSEMYVRDDRSRDKGKLKAMPKIYLYPEARAMFPEVPSQTIASLENSIAKKYRAKRFELVWTSRASLPTYKYPTPFPVPNQGWNVRLEDNCPIVSARIGDARHEFRLRGGHQFRRQMAAVKQITTGEAEPGQLDLFRNGKSVMCKMVAWLPRAAATPGHEGTLIVRTDAEALIVALNLKDERLWTYHGDQARRWIAEHRRMLSRLADDTKAEHRPIAPFTARREAAVRKYHDRMASLTHQVSMMVAGYAKRRKFAAVRYDDSLHDFCPQFPWFALRAKIAEKCDAAGIEFASAGDEEAEVSPSPLAGE